MCTTTGFDIYRAWSQYDSGEMCALCIPCIPCNAHTIFDQRIQSNSNVRRDMAKKNSSPQRDLKFRFAIHAHDILDLYGLYVLRMNPL